MHDIIIAKQTVLTILTGISMKLRNLLPTLLAAMLCAAAASAQFHGIASSEYITTKDGVSYNLYNKDKTAMLVKGRQCSVKNYEIPQYITGSSGTKYEVTEIKSQAFASNNLLESVTIPISVQVIGHAAFYNCKKLKTVNAPNSFMYYIGIDVFEGTPWLTDYAAKYKNKPLYWCGWVIGVGEIIDDDDLEIEEGYVGINHVFQRVNSYGVIIPKSLRYWGGPSTFNKMPNLTYFSVSKANPYFYEKKGVLYRKSNDLSEHDGYDLAGKGDYLAVYPKKKAMMKQYKTEPGIVGIDQDAFAEVKYLKEIVVSEGVKYIGINAFRYMERLEYLQLPSTIEKLDRAVISCHNLKTIVILATKKPVMSKDSHMFEFCSPELVIHVPASLLEEYKADEAYTQYAKEIRAIDSQVLAIGQTRTDGDAEVEAIYSTDGTRLNAMQKGVNIVRMSDGTVRKVMRK